MKFLMTKARYYWLAMFIVGGYAIAEHDLLSINNLLILLRQCSIFGFAVVGVYVSTLADSVNVSSGAQVAFTSVFVLFLSSYFALPPWLILILSATVAAAMGALYAYATIKTRMSVIILSLGMVNILNGVNWHIQSSYLMKRTFFGFTGAAYGDFLGFPMPALVFLGCCSALGFFLRESYLGRALIVVGGNKDEAQRAGMPVNTIKIVAYIIGFLFINASGLFLVGRTSTSGNQYGENYFFDVIVALCVGRVSLWGGRGSLTGAILGCFCVVLMGNFFTIHDATLINQQMLKGFIIVITLLEEHNSSKSHKSTLR